MRLVDRKQVRHYVADLVRYATAYRETIQDELAEFMEGSEYVPSDVSEGWGDALQSSCSDIAEHEADLQYHLLHERLKSLESDKAIAAKDRILVETAIRSLMDCQVKPCCFRRWQEQVNRAIFGLFPDFEISSDFKVVKK